MKVTIYAVKFNTDDRCYETEIMRNVEVVDFDDYNNVVTISSSVFGLGHSKQMKLDTVEYIKENGYLATTSSTDDKECLLKVINSMEKKSTSTISAETDRLELLSQISI